MNNSSTKISESAKLLGIEINNYLNFESHVSTICKNAAGQLNVLLVS